ncbi:MAG: DUF2333 family protein [Gammaproteobacteria bacterium]
MRLGSVVKPLLGGAGGVVLVIGLLCVGLGWYWSCEPKAFSVRSLPEFAESTDRALVPGEVTILTLINLVESLLDKPGGYVSNDIMPPGIFMDNMPAWEYGVLVQVRDFSRALRKDISRSQSQSTENPFLTVAEPKLHFDHSSWWLPETEHEYRDAVGALRKYRQALSDSGQSQAQFYARADNLRVWLADVETRLGSLSQRLSASVGRTSLNVDLAGDPDAMQSTHTPDQVEVQTPWLEIDDVFYETRGSAWALMHLLNAISVDFRSVLEKKNALVSLKQIIRELEGTQQPLRSPLVLNGSGMGVLANHSLVMANYISRANAAIIDLRELLSQG